MAYASRTGTRRNLEALRAAGWGLLVSCAGVQRDEGFGRIIVDNPAWPLFCRGETPTDALLERAFVPTLERFGPPPDFVVAPDIVMGGAASLALTARWLPRVLASARLALVAVQNGMTWRDVLPLVRRFGRELVDVGGRAVRRVGVFVGGDTAWKLASLRGWGRLCRRLRCWFHVGRMTYMPGHVVDWLLASRSRLSRADRDLIVREIDEAARPRRLGMACDVAAWSRLREAFGPGSDAPPGADAQHQAGSPGALIAAYAAENVNWVADPAGHIAALHQAHEDLEQAFAERDDLLRHRAASEAPGWTYQGPHGAGAHLSDAVVAGRIRMLMRDDLDHEAVCVMARDRIRDLSREVARQRGLLGSRLPEGDALRILVEVGSTESACRMVVPDGMAFDEAAKRVEAAKRAIGAELAEQGRCPFSTSAEAGR